MNKKILLIFPLIFILSSCNNSNIKEVKNPFSDDKYSRIGIKSIYNITSGLNDDEYKKLNIAVGNTSEVDPKTDSYVTSYKSENETRDLKYAYFGKEISEMFFNSLTTNIKTVNKYKNNVTIEKSNLSQIIQMATGNNNIYFDTNVYTFDDSYKSSLSNTYSSRLQAIKYIDKERKNIDSNKVTESINKKEYTSSETSTIFNLTPLKNINSTYFRSTETYKFKLLGDNAVYGKTNDNKFVLKEAYSVFNNEFTTALGKKYLSVDNYFYEGLLDDVKGDGNLCFKDFRFYHEILILSEAVKGDDVPILYLEKPVLVWFNEVKITFNYDDPTLYNDNIPEVSTSLNE